MEDEFFLLLVGVLGVWRVTHLLQAEDGPWDLVVRLRARAGDGAWGRLLDCFYCLSLWVAIPFAYLCGAGWGERLLLWPAYSAGAILIERAIPDRFFEAAPRPVEDVADGQALEPTETNSEVQ